LLKSTDITFQLYVSRLVSLLLLLVTLAAAWGIMTDLVPSDHPLRWMVPVTVALLPPFTDLMTAVNNDVGATAAFSMFLWGCVYLFRRGLSVGGLLWSAAAMAIAIWTKLTTLPALPLFLLAILLALFHRHLRLVWIALAIGVLVGLLAVLSWGDAAFWYRYTSQSAPTRISTSFAPFASNSFQLQIVPDGSPAPAIRQFLPPGWVANLKGKTVTLGAWMWTTQSLRGLTPVLEIPDTGQQYYKEITLDRVPNFYAFSTVVPKDATRIGLALEQPNASANTTIFYNGLVFAEGQYPLGESPEFENAGGARGIWGGKPFVNLLRNPSAEQAWFKARPWADGLGGKIFGIPLSLAFGSFVDWQGAGWYYQAAFERLFRSFWAGFGWGAYSVQDPGAYSFILITAAAGVGIVAMLRRRGRDLNGSMGLFFLIAMALVWGAALVRGLGDSLSSYGYLPIARYGYPVIIPTVLFLCVGWSELLRYLARWSHLKWTLLSLLYLAFFLVFDGYVLVSIVNFFTKG
jgi:hypothetical protein